MVKWYLCGKGFSAEEWGENERKKERKNSESRGRKWRENASTLVLDQKLHLTYGLNFFSNDQGLTKRRMRNRVMKER